MALFFVVTLAGFILGYAALDSVLPYEISARRVGGLTFVRFGRLSFSYSIRRV